MSDSGETRPRPSHPASAEDASARVAPTVTELARALTEKERKGLLDRINRSLSVGDDGQRRVIHESVREDRRGALVAADLRRLTTLERFQLWLRRIVSSRNDNDVFLQFRLHQARNRVRKAAADLVDFDGRVVLPALPESIRELNRKAAYARDFFETLWADVDTLRAVIDFLLARRIPDAKRSLGDFCSSQELQEVFRISESRNQLKQRVLDSVSSYVEGIPASVIEQLESQLHPLYVLRELARFDFDELWSQFQSSERAAISDRTIEFKAAAIDRVIESLEALYLALHGIRSVSKDYVVFGELIEFYSAKKRGDQTNLSPPDGGGSACDASMIRGVLTALTKEASRVRAALPLTDIIRFFRGDPYYRFLAYTPKLRLADFYYANLKIEVLGELDARFGDLRMGVLGQLTQEAFPGGLRSFEFFHPEIPVAVRKLSVGQLRVYRSLQTIQSFIETVYRQGLADFLRILARILPARIRQSGADMALFIAGLDDVADRLRAFDLSFSPDSDDGKAFFRFRYAGADRDPTQVSAFRSLIAQKEREATSMIDKFQELLRSLVQGFALVHRGGIDQLSESYRGFEPSGGPHGSLPKRLAATTSSLEKSEKILKQMVGIDQEE